MKIRPASSQLPLPIVEPVSQREAEIYFGTAWVNALARRSIRLAKNRTAGVGVLSTGVSDTRTLPRNPWVMFATFD